MNTMIALTASVTVLLSGCQIVRPHSTQLPNAPGAAATTAGAAGSSIDVEYIALDRFDDVAADPISVYPVKFVCGEATASSWHTPGTYKTVINILNLSRFQKEIQWRFTNYQEAFEGASALIPSHGSIAMDCEFVVRQFATVTDVSEVLEGFVVIEDLVENGPIRVAVVYTTLHKQLHDRPDLIPVAVAKRFCDLDDQRRLLVTVRNQGELASNATQTSVRISESSPVLLTTPALAPGDSVTLQPVALPQDEGFEAITIHVDNVEIVAETNEFNNIGHGGCTLIN